MAKKETKVEADGDNQEKVVNGDGDNKDEDALTSPSSVRRSKRQRKPVTPLKSSTPPSPKTKRQRRMSHKMEEMLQEKDKKKIEKELAKIKPKRKYRKRQKKTTPMESGGDAAIKSGGKKQQSVLESDEESSLNEKDMVCSICNCTVDFSDRDLFDFPEQQCHNVVASSEEDAEESVKDGSRQNCGNVEGNENGSNSSDGSDYYGIKLPRTLYDRNNALLICDGEGCNRCYHQRCHFVPVLCVPKQKWYCLICQMKDKLKNVKKKRGRKKKISTTATTGTDLSQIADGDDNVHDIQISESAPLTEAELDVIYRVTNKDQNENEAAGPSSFSSSQILLAQKRFEFHSATLKSELMHKELSKRIKSTIDHNLSSIRLCQNSIRALTETARARKSIVENYNITKRLPQTLIQNFHKFAHCKLRLRDLMFSLKYVIENKNDSKLVRNWFETLKSGPEGSLALASTTATVTNSSSHNSVIDGDRVGISQASKDPPVPDMISVQSSVDNTEYSITRSDRDFDISALEKKLFVGKATRKEARFDIKDYDADEDDEEESDEDPTNKIMCFICSSGHVDDENDVVMCDGKDCFRALHMQCRTPKLTQQMLDEDPNGTFFCPFCTCFATALHYIETEFYADERGIDMEDDEEDDCKNPNDDSSTKSWEQAEEVFPTSVEEFDVADSWKEGKHDDRSERIIESSLGIDVTNETGDIKTIGNHDTINGQDEEHDDESDTDFSSQSMDDQSCSSSDSDASNESGLDWGINKAEISALSCSESDSDSDSDSQSQEDDNPGARRSRRLSKEKEVKVAKRIDGGAMDTTNIVRGKRRRTTVDYKRLNDAMFGEGGEMKPTKDIDDEEEYQFVMQSGAKSDESDDDSESESEDDDEEEDDDDDSSGKEGSSSSDSEEVETERGGSKAIHTDDESKSKHSTKNQQNKKKVSNAKKDGKISERKQPKTDAED